MPVAFSCFEKFVNRICLHSASPMLLPFLVVPHCECVLFVFRPSGPKPHQSSLT